jgi:hypothetical protein
VWGTNFHNHIKQPLRVQIPNICYSARKFS